MSVANKGSGSDVDKANLNGGVTVSGYLTGVIGMTSITKVTHESECMGGKLVSTITRTGGG